MMQIKRVILHYMKLQLKQPFTASFGTVTDKEFILVKIMDENGVIGWGESVAMVLPWYSEETVKGNWQMLKEHLIPMLIGKHLEDPSDVSTIFQKVRRNNMAKSALEGAVWDLFAKRKGVSLAQALGGTKKEVEVGVSIGIEASIPKLLDVIHKNLDLGYKRIKVKIKPGWDIAVMEAIRNKFPNIQLMADANSAYSLAHSDLLQELDQFDLTMIEQPLAHDDIIDHSALQKRLKTPICLDESIHSVEDARKAIELGSCKIINIKIGRVGGLTEAKRIHDLCKQQNVPVWCGGMMESGIGRAHNIAITTLDNFIFPGDTAGSKNYWEEDIIDPEVTPHNGVITLLEKPGIGYEPNYEKIEKNSLYSEVFRS